MYVRIAYGELGLDLDLPDATDIIQSTHCQGLPDEAEAVLRALRAPIQSASLVDRVNEHSRVLVVHTDITRATPNERILPVLLAELAVAGVPRDQITLINALGTHRPQTEAELSRLLGPEVYSAHRCLQHDAFDDDLLVSLGTTSRGNPVRLHHLLLESDMCILTGFIEPHFFAGFSGGPKGVLPSLAGFESVLSNHGAEMISHADASWGVLEGNPIWEEMREVALRVPNTFLLNVAMNSQKEITGVFSGDLVAAHAAGCQFVKQTAMVPVPGPYDIVVTSNSGYPLDQNLYQSVKGMSAASQIVRAGGAIIMAAECADGIPQHGRYADLLREAGSPQSVLEMLSQPDFSEHDQWQVQIQAQIQLKAEVFVYSHKLTDDQISQALLTPCSDVSAQVADLVDSHAGLQPARVCAMPDGPLTLAYLDPFPV